VTDQEQDMKTQSQRTGRLCVCLCGALALVVLVAPSAAPAAQLHAFTSSFGAPGSGAGQLSLTLTGSPGAQARGSGLAVNAATGDVYVADTANDRIDQFSSSGAFIRAFGWEVNATTPEVKLQVCTTATGCRAGSSGDEPGQLEAPTFIAVDNSCALHNPALTESTVPKCSEFDPSAGDLYVTGIGQNLISAKNILTKFDSEGHLVEAWGDNGEGFEKDGPANGQLNGANAPEGPFGQPAGIAVGPTGHLWVGVGGTIKAPNAHVYEFGQAGGFEREWGLPELQVATPQGLAVDSSDDVYVSNNAERVEKFTSVGKNLGIVYRTPVVVEEGGGEHYPEGITAITLDPLTDDLYLDEGTTVQDVSHQCEPNSTGCIATQTFGSGHLDEAAGLAIGPGSTVYAANTGTNQIAVFKASLEANIQAPTEVKATSAVLHATVNPEGGEVTSCNFQSGASKAYGRNLPCLDGEDHEVGTLEHPLTGSSPVALHAKPEGLKAGATFHYRLRAANAGKEEIHSEDEAFETLVLARIEAEEATEVTAASATLNAKVNPRGLPVEACQIEWGTTSTSYEHAEPCQPASLPAGTSAAAVAAHLTGLSPETTYHWRILATDANGVEASPDNTFVFFPGPPPTEVSQECANEPLREVNASTALPDCRAYEQVTPPQKNGAVVAEATTSALYGLSQSGSRLLAPTVQCFGGAGSCGPLRQAAGLTYEFSRSPGGWQATPLTPSAGQFVASTVLTESGDAPDQLFSVALPAPPSPAGREWFYARHSDGSMQPVGPVASGLGYHKGNYLGGVAATADLAHVVYNGEENFWPAFDETEGETIYEYAGAAERPFLVAVTGKAGSTELIGTCGAHLTGYHYGNNETLSADGRTVYFRVRPCPSGTGANAGKPVLAYTIYARIDGESEDPRTVKISAPAAEPECDSACQAQPAALAQLAGDSTDGSMVYFLSTQQLTDEASEDSHGGDTANGNSCPLAEGKGGCNLYLYADPQEDPLTGNHLTAVSAGDSSGQGPQVQGVMAISSDGARAYFVAKGTLTGANAEGKSPSEGANNLYVYDAEEAKTRFIVTLSAASCGQEFADCEQWGGSRSANVTPEGRYLLFTSHAALTPDATREKGPAQVYRYDAQAEALTRVSIGRRGFNDDGNDNGNAADASIVPAEQQRGVSEQQQQGRPPLDPSLSADGHRVFFESPAALAPGALSDVLIAFNEVNRVPVFAENIYEWEQQGTGSCDETAGCLYLISDGRDATEGFKGSSVKLIGTDATGENAFFSTADRLVPTDTDTGLDVYDARALGGFAPPPHSETCETSEACHGESTREAPLSSPGTMGFNGLGNVQPTLPPTLKVSTPAQIRAQKLARALKACRTKHNRKRRAACKRRARKRYGPPHQAKSHRGRGR
jgi:DNA-binding beta-propeller fold protein YncE